MDDQPATNERWKTVKEKSPLVMKRAWKVPGKETRGL